MLKFYIHDCAFSINPILLQVHRISRKSRSSTMITLSYVVIGAFITLAFDLKGEFIQRFVALAIFADAIFQLALLYKVFY